MATQINKTKMPELVQVLYGTVAAVNFYNIFSTSADTVNSLNEDSVLFFTTAADFFRLFLFMFTLLILIHDWYAYYLNDQKRSFFAYIPQAFSLFFLSQMFICANTNHLKYWYAFGLWYTVSNICNSLFKRDCDKEYYCWLIFVYTIHVVMAIAGFCLATNNKPFDPANYVWLVITTVVVVLLWWAGDKRVCKKQ